MHAEPDWPHYRLRIALACTVLAMAGCAVRPPADIPAEPEPRPVAVEPQVPVAEPPAPQQPEPQEEAEPEPAVVAPPPAVAIVLSGRDPRYVDVAEAIGNYFIVDSTYDISDKSLSRESSFRLISDSEVSTVIAIGLQAARQAVAMADVPVVFSQVFNYQDHELVTKTSRGVASFPPLDAQIAAWKDLDPGVSSIGIIIGDGHTELIAEAEAAARRHDVALTVRIANSDQQLLYFFKRMVRDIDGFWLFPDNRILSVRVLKEILKDANRRNIAVLVPSDSLLKLGAAISISPGPDDIADAIATVVRRIQAGQIADIPPLTPLSGIEVAVNDDVLRRRVLAADTGAAAETLR